MINSAEYRPMELSGDTEDRIFKAAIDVFARFGRDGARMQDIADRAGVTKALVHYYYRSKDRLYEEVFRYLFRTYFSVMGEAMDQAGRFRDVLQVFISTYMDALQAHPAIAGVMMHEMSAGAASLKRQMRSVVGTQSSFPPKVFARRFRQALADGEVRDADPMLTFVTIIGSCLYFTAARPMIEEIDPDLAKDTPRAIEKRKRHLFDLIYTGLQPRAETRP